MGGGYKKSLRRNNNNNRNNYNDNNNSDNGGGQDFYVDKVGSNNRNNTNNNGPRYLNRNRNNGDGGNNNRNSYNNNNNNSGRNNYNNSNGNGNNRNSYNNRNNSYNNNSNNNSNNNNNNKDIDKLEEEFFAENSNKSQLDLDTRSYFTRIEGLICKQNSEEQITREEIDIIIENAHKEIENKEVSIACDKKTSLVLETMFQKCKDPSTIVKYVESFRKDFEKLIADSNGSRVIEALLRCTPKIINRGDKATIKLYNEALFEFIDTLLKDTVKTVTDRYATYVFSSIVLILSGTIKEKKVSAQQQEQASTFNGKKKPYKERILEEQQQKEDEESIEYPVSKEYTDKLKEILEKVKDPIKSNMVKFAFQKEPIESIKAVFQVLSQAPVEIYRSWLEAFIKMSNVEFSKKQFIKVMKSQYGSVFCEMIVKTCPEEIFLELIGLVKHDIMDLCEDMYANHVIQNFIDKCSKPAHFMILVQEFKDHFKNLFSIGRGLVVQKLLEGSLKFNTFEKEIIKVLYEAVLADYKNGQKDIAQTLLGLENNVSSTQMYSACGSAILQLLFKFSNDFNKTAIESFISLEPEYLISLATNNIGSKVYDVFLDSQNVPLAKKNQLIIKFNGNFVTIGEDRYGSYTIEKMYKIADFKQKEVIAKELMKEEERLFARPCGRYVLMICQINKYKKKKDNWATEQNSKDKKRKLFNDIINDNGNSNYNNNSNNKNKNKNQREEDDYSEDNYKEEKSKKKHKKSHDEDEIDEIFNSKSKK
ncbi:hypothetical protein DICPUDRAFT_150810 [Dictyostelium purpureum]|uniref:PUM-HD domain-containing protein n=1 Tax=Dictyostelium purpureum TaxID=5786 RepID=F0ZHB1_DICPU|nr:uncharacterized protein DICPUDRAFT_150810 [Dictyostelium purpureum]EGC36656.1 hypothetical protein DICPUDRAFT_150810 [Dictyostelium purpureum]|eukprot:XP_003286824.1 hypothetical protein DICPUDRAFT_150810 [Dictyostelium purpureum]